jgi:hypothetical protein
MGILWNSTELTGSQAWIEKRILHVDVHMRLVEMEPLSSLWRRRLEQAPGSEAGVSLGQRLSSLLGPFHDICNHGRPDQGQQIQRRRANCHRNRPRNYPMYALGLRLSSTATDKPLAAVAYSHLYPNSVPAVRIVCNIILYGTYQASTLTRPLR